MEKPNSYDVCYLDCHYYACSADVKALDPAYATTISLNPKHVWVVPVAVCLTVGLSHDRSLLGSATIESVSIAGRELLEWDEGRMRYKQIGSEDWNPWRQGNATPVNWPPFSYYGIGEILSVRMRPIGHLPIDIALTVYGVPGDAPN